MRINMDREEQITDLTKLWYKLIGSGDCKDRDCHWYIETLWSYDEPPKYFVWHRGSVYEDVHEQYETYEQALNVLKGKLSDAIRIKQEQMDIDNSL